MVSVVGVLVLLFFLVAVLCFWLFHSAIVILIVVMKTGRHKGIEYSYHSIVLLLKCLIGIEFTTLLFKTCLAQTHTRS